MYLCGLTSLSFITGIFRIMMTLKEGYNLSKIGALITTLLNSTMNDLQISTLYT